MQTELKHCKIYWDNNYAGRHIFCASLLIFGNNVPIKKIEAYIIMRKRAQQIHMEVAKWQ